MDDCEAMDCKVRVNVRGNFAQLGVGHRFVGFVFEIERALAFEIVAHESVEDDCRAIFKRFEVEQDFARLDGFADEKDDVFINRGLLAAAYRREEGDFVA